MNLLSGLRTMSSLLTITILVFFLSCGQRNNHSKKNTIKDVELPSDLRKTKKSKKATTALESENIKDSLRLDSILTNALHIASQNSNKSRFHKAYQIVLDSLNIVEVDIDIDYHFTKLYPSLIIRRKTSADFYIDIYMPDNNKYEKKLAHQQWRMEYESDKIRDINGDGLKDFVLNWYGVNGCCLKAYSIVYLLRADKKSFSESFEFINPSFSPREKIIRGIGYGHPGETEMYKYKWNGEAVDTVEYVSYERDATGKKTGKVIVSKDIYIKKKGEILKRLNAAPIEYRHVVGYDWFTGVGLK